MLDCDVGHMISDASHTKCECQRTCIYYDRFKFVSLVPEGYRMCARPPVGSHFLLNYAAETEEKIVYVLVGVRTTASIRRLGFD